MKKVTVFIDNEYADVVTITAIGRSSINETNVNISADKIEDGMCIEIPKKKDGEIIND